MHKRRLWRLCGPALVLSVVLAALTGCSEHRGMKPDPASEVLDDFTVQGFVRVNSFSGIAYQATGYYFGPSTFDVNRDVGTSLKLSNAGVDRPDGRFEDLAAGAGQAGDGTECRAFVAQFVDPGSGEDPPAYVGLSSDQAMSIRAGTHAAIAIDVECDRPA